MFIVIRIKFMTKINNNFKENKNLRNVLGKFSTGVTVVTTKNKQNTPIGITVNSFSSVSLDPPLISWCLGKEQPSHTDFVNANGFAVNILSKKQLDICNRFANPCIDKFKKFSYKTSNEGYPIISDSLAVITCKTWSIYPGGDHDIFVGQVIEFNSINEDPLIFWNGKLS